MALGDGIYATKAEFLAYAEGIAVTDDNALKRRLYRAEEEVDDYLRHQRGDLIEVAPGVFRRFGSPKTTNERNLTTAEIVSLSRITCARAEYRAIMGDAFFRQDQYESTTGPDFSTSGKLDRIGPRVKEELARSPFMESAAFGHVTV